MRLSKITKYWLDHYVDAHCTVCGNSGVIDSTGVKTAAGFVVGRKNWCLCPNGQALRKQVGGYGPDAPAATEKET